MNEWDLTSRDRDTYSTSTAYVHVVFDAEGIMVVHGHVWEIGENHLQCNAIHSFEFNQCEKNKNSTLRNWKIESIVQS